MEEGLGFIGRFVGYVLFELFLYSTGRLVLRIVSGGKLRAGRFMGWSSTFGVGREIDGTRLLSAEFVAVVGFLTWATIAIATFAIF